MTKSIYETAYGVKFPLYFVSTTLENNVEKMNHISNQGTLSATAPAVLRGEEPLDYNSLISIKAGDIVLAYKREQDTNAVYVLVLNHQFKRKPAITAGFNLETKKYISAGKGQYPKWKRVNQFPAHILETLKHLYTRSIESFETNSRKRKKQIYDLNQRLETEELTPEQRSTIVRRIQSSPNFDIPTQVEESDEPIPATPASTIQGGAHDTPRGETQGGASEVNREVDPDPNKNCPTMSPTPIVPIPVAAPTPNNNEPVPMVEPVPNVTNVTPPPSDRILRPRKKNINYRNLASGQKDLTIEKEVLCTLMARVPIKNDIPH